MAGNSGEIAGKNLPSGNNADGAGEKASQRGQVQPLVSAWRRPGRTDTRLKLRFGAIW
jgi:hypothetical protein